MTAQRCRGHSSCAARAAEKQKEIVGCAVFSINRPPLRGLEPLEHKHRLLTAELLRLHQYSGRPLGFHYALALRLLTFPPHRTSPESDRRRCRWLPACRLSPLCRGFASKQP